MKMKMGDGPMSKSLRPTSTSNTETLQQGQNYPSVSPEKQNIIFATNYSVSSVDQFVVSARKSDWNGRKRARISSPLEHEEDEETDKCETSFDEARSARKSSRRRSKTVKLEKSRVRYDVNLVPMVDRNKMFLEKWRTQINLPSSKERSKEYSGSSEKDQHICFECQRLGRPFNDDDSVVWIPSTRAEWEDCLSEMTAVCTSAALRRHVAGHDRSTTKPFYAPLSQDYIRDRVDIDDPLMGFQIRHKSGGWLQGFIMYTHFTTWTHYFKWDSLHAVSGVQVSHDSKTKPGYKIDSDGSLAIELEGQPRSGDPLGGGVVFRTIAEIGLLGGLGCGEYLLRMALHDIRKNGNYRFVVLQATDSSRPFYERFGFVRVGAISRYGPKSSAKSVDPQQVTLSDIMGYRHWTYAHESERSLGKHGGPSYMMALKLGASGIVDDSAICRKCKKGIITPTEIIMSSAVSVKPTIMQLGNAATPATKKKILQPPDVEFSTPQVDLSSNGYPKKRGRKRKSIAYLNSPRKPSSSHSPGRGIIVLPPEVKPLSIGAESLHVPPPKRPTSFIPTASTPSVTKSRKSIRNSGDSFGHQEALNSLLETSKLRKLHDLYKPVLSSQSVSGDQLSKRKKGDCERTRANANEVNNIIRSPRHQRDSSPGHGILLGSPPVLPEQKPGSSAGEAPISRERSLWSKKSTKKNSMIRKQKAPSTSRSIQKDKLFYNKVVKQIGCKQENYYFVLHFDIELPRMKLLPMKADGNFMRSRNGRRCFKVDTERKVMIANVSMYEIVPSHAVARTAYVDSEVFDVLD